MPKLFTELADEIKKLSTELEEKVKELFGEEHDMTLEHTENTEALHNAVDDEVAARKELGEGEGDETDTAKTTAQGGADVAAEKDIQGNGAEPQGDKKD